MDVLVLVILLFSLAQPSVTMYLAAKWRATQKEKFEQDRRLFLGSLHRAEQAHLIAAHELGLDAKALQIASLELTEALDENGEKIFGDNWESVRDSLRQMARDHDRSVIEKKLEQTFKVPITSGDGFDENEG